ncbi:hypothetical protein [Nostoc sp.]|uniref:hypothetical protein n=1 Tax=Nostoc sp. TaxID=1180 RepID=UPI002FFCA7C0
MVFTVETAQLNNQSILQNFGLVEEIDEQVAEIISGGYEVFTIRNNTGYDIKHKLDGKLFRMKPNQESVYTTYNGGIIQFDADMRGGYQRWKSYNLRDGKIYEFKDNGKTAGNPYDINIYRVG